MNRDIANRTGRKYGLYGFTVGLGIWVVALIIEAFVTGQSVDGDILKRIHSANYAFFLLDLQPFFFAYIGFKLGLLISSKSDEVESLVASNKQRNRSLIGIVDSLKNGNFEISKDAETQDKLINSIFDLRDSLKSSKEEESIRKKEDEQRHWVAQGLAKFGEILRANNDDMTELSYNIISQLIKYISANQGGIYLLSEDEIGNKVFEMKACYAYDRRKFTDKVINFGEGLVGACAKESKTVYLKKVPDSYLSITSGLGEANPKHLLLIPLKFNDETHGVLEMASFNPFEPYVIDFIEKVAESIASTVANVKINIRTAELLRDSQEQAEMLSSQEEEMRQNMEELQATQEESLRQTERFSGYLNALDSVLIRAEFDSFGNLVSANENFLEKFEIPHFDEVFERNITSFIHPDSLSDFRMGWGKVVADNQWYNGEFRCITYIDKSIYISSTLSRINRNDGELEKVLLLALDSTAQKKKELESTTILSAISDSLLKAELSNTGDLLGVNDKLLHELGYASGEIHNINDFINELDKPAFDKAWMRLVNNGLFEGVINITSLDGKVKALEVNLIGIRNFSNDISKIILIGTDRSAIKAVEEKYDLLNAETLQLKDKLDRTDEEINKKVREVRENLASQYKEVERVRIRNDKTVENAPLAIVTFNNLGIVEVFNKRAVELWGYQPNDVLNLHISKLFAKEQQQNDGIATSICDNDKIKPINQREAVKIVTNDKQTIDVFVTLADARVAKDHNYVAYFETYNN